MRSTKKMYADVATRCSAYKKTTTSELSNSVDDDSTSCLNCSYFAKDEHCVLELYDAIAEQLL